MRACRSRLSSRAIASLARARCAARWLALSSGEALEHAAGARCRADARSPASRRAWRRRQRTAGGAGAVLRVRRLVTSPPAPGRATCSRAMAVADASVACARTASPPPAVAAIRHRDRPHRRPTTAPRRSRAPLARSCCWLLAGWRGWHWWQARQQRDERARSRDAAQQWQALDARIDALRSDQRAQAQRLQQADATNRVLRDELLGIGQRAALLEDSVRKLADPRSPRRAGVAAGRSGAAARPGRAAPALSGDLDGARRAYALAGGVLAGIDDPAYLNLRQALVQERAALDALGADPKARPRARLDAFAATLAARRARRRSPGTRRCRGGGARSTRIVECSRPATAVATEGADREAALAALQLELTLARAGDRTPRRARLSARRWRAPTAGCAAVAGFAGAAPAARAIAAAAGTCRWPLRLPGWAARASSCRPCAPHAERGDDATATTAELALASRHGNEASRHEPVPQPAVLDRPGAGRRPARASAAAPIRATCWCASAAATTPPPSPAD